MIHFLKRAALWLFIAACAVGSIGLDVLAANQAPRAKNLRILFVGNSFTYCNDFPGMVKEMGKKSGCSLTIETIAQGGYTLAWYADRKNSYGAQVYRKLTKKKWDYVVLQERSYSSVTEAKTMNKSLKKLIPYVRAAGAQPVLLMTWAPKEGHTEYQQGHFKGMSRRQCQRQMARTYKKLGKKQHALVSPAGTAFWKYSQDETGVDLYSSDGKHPSKAGSYLSACVLYATIFQKSPVGLKDGILKESVALGLQKTAGKVVLGNVAEPPSSEGAVENVELGVGESCPLPKGKSLVWKSSEKKTAVVYKGKITAKAVGQAVLTAYDEKKNLSLTCKVRVKKAPTRILVEGKKKMRQGTETMLKVSIPKGTHAGKFQYRSSNPRVLTVDKNGKVKAWHAGKAVITVTAYNGVSGSLEIQVKPFV